MRWLSVLQIFGLIILAGGYIFSINTLSGLTNLEITENISKIEKVTPEGITQGDLEKLKQGLYALKAETTPKILRNEKLSKASSLMQLFNILIKDNKITLSQYNIWMDRFSSRADLDPRSLNKYVRDFKAKQSKLFR